MLPNACDCIAIVPSKYFCVLWMLFILCALGYLIHCFICIVAWFFTVMHVCISIPDYVDLRLELKYSDCALAVEVSVLLRAEDRFIKDYVMMNAYSSMRLSPPKKQQVPNKSKCIVHNSSLLPEELAEGCTFSLIGPTSDTVGAYYISSQPSTSTTLLKKRKRKGVSFTRL